MLDEHVARGADMTVGCVEVPLAEAAGQLGVMEVDADFRVIGFQEKPAQPRPDPRPARHRARQHGHLRLQCRVPLRAADARCAPTRARATTSATTSSRAWSPSGARVYAHRLQDSCTQLIDGRAVLARRRHHRRVLGSQPRAHARDARRSTSTTSRGRSGPTRSSCRRPSSSSTSTARRGARGRFDGLGRLHRQRLDAARLAPLLQRARAQLLRDRGRGDPARGRDRPRREAASAWWSTRARASPRACVAGYDPDEDRKRFHVTDKGITLITPGDARASTMHHLALSAAAGSSADHRMHADRAGHLPVPRGHPRRAPPQAGLPPAAPAAARTSRCGRRTRARSP